MTDPRQTTEYLLGQLVIKIDALNDKMDTIKAEMEEDRKKRDSLESDVEELKAWVDGHINFHEKEQANIIISKPTFYALLTALIASGLLLKLWEHFTHG